MIRLAISGLRHYWKLSLCLGAGVFLAAAILTGSLPAHKMGVYMGIFNFFIVIPQILAATILGFMVKSLFGGDSIYALLTGGISMMVAAVLILFVKDSNPK